ncbi:MAG: LysE family transporter [Proteobacteria bacterium]|nr:LysE family transporter [Pseudomonadota bacterium]
MSLELYLSFVLASTLLILFPGQSVMLTISHSLTWGVRLGLLSVAGAIAAVAVQLAALAIGLSSVLAFAAQWFEVIRWAGVAYLLFLGVQQLRARHMDVEEAGAGPRSPAGLFWQGFIVSLLNPKSLLFYAALFPHFIDTEAAAAPQLIILSATFLVIAAGLTAMYAVLAHQVGSFFRGPNRARLRNRLTGGIFIGAGVVLALARR